jgi:hypothetical protein
MTTPDAAAPPAPVEQAEIEALRATARWLVAVAEARRYTRGTGEGIDQVLSSDAFLGRDTTDDGGGSAGHESGDLASNRPRGDCPGEGLGERLGLEALPRSSARRLGRRVARPAQRRGSWSRSLNS